ncbi:S-adenosyl-L-methionine-dependent methyltransferase [Trichoderma ceciliae]
MASTVEGDGVEKDGKQFRVVREGKATILVPQGAKIGEDPGEVQQVFYNPIQQYNRDLSVLAIKTYGEQSLEQRRERNVARSNKQGKKRKRDERDEKDDGTLSTETETPGLSVSDQAAEASDEQRTHRSTFRILDALSASGLRALRYGHELPFVTSINANDLSKSAAESIKLNVNHNGLDGIISVTNEDALAHMYRAIADGLSKRDRHGNPTKSHKFDVIDLDPYGTAAPFFDAALQSVRDDGGLLCITCTDSAVWAGHSYCEKTFALYGGTPIKGMHSHEAGLRLILNAVATSGARYGLAIEPLLSLSIDFYTKLFIKVTKSPQAVKFLGSKTMIVYSCDHGCSAWETQYLLRSRPTPNKKGSGSFYKHGMAAGPTTDRHCQHCGHKMHVNGPMYGGHIHSADFIQRLLDQIPDASPEVYGTLPRLEGMLRTALTELIPGPEVDTCTSVDAKDARQAEIDHCPFFVIPSKLATVVSCAPPSDDMFRGALIHLGYQVGRSHCRPGSIKTDAPWSTIWWIITEWIRQESPIKASKFTPLMPGWKILHSAGLVGQDDGAPQEPDSKAEDAQEEREPQSEEMAGSPSELELRKTLVFDDDLARLGRLRDAQKLSPGDETGYIISILSEDSEKPEERFRLLLLAATDSIPDELWQHRIDGLPSYLRPVKGERKVDVVVSTKSGVGLALQFWQTVLRPLWSLVEEQSSEATDRESPNIFITQDALSVPKFARTLGRSQGESIDEALKPRTVVLLSGDGGIVDLLNGSSHDAPSSSKQRQLLLALLPLGTGNALFHSLHRPLWASDNGKAEDASPLVLGLRTLFKGTSADLPLFQASFSPGSRIIKFTPATGDSSGDDTPGNAFHLAKEETQVSRVYGAVVASYGFHSSIVYESDTPEYRIHGDKRFGMVAQELLRESHPYSAQVEARRPSSSSSSSKWESIPGDKHAYVLVTPLSNLERTFTISPASKPLDGKLRLVHFGTVGGERTMDVMMKAYDGGKHVGTKWDDGHEVRYDEVDEVRVTILEEDERWRKVCVDGTIVDIPRGGQLSVRKEEKSGFQVLVDSRVLPSS